MVRYRLTRTLLKRLLGIEDEVYNTTVFAAVFRQIAGEGLVDRRLRWAWLGIRYLCPHWVQTAGAHIL